MKKIARIPMLILMVPALCSCDILGAIRTITGIKPEYENYKEFLEKGLGYSHSSTYEDAKEGIYQNLLYWDVQLKDQSTDDAHTIYNAPFSETLSIYSDKAYIYTRDGRDITYIKGATVEESYFRYSVANHTIAVDLDNHKYMYGDTAKREELVSDEEKALLNIYPDNNGYLIVTEDDTLLYLDKNLNDFYVNDEDTNTFHLTKEKSITVPNSETLTAALNEAKESRIAVYLPKPTQNLDGEYWYGYNYYDIDSFGKKYEDRDHHISWAEAILPGVEAYTYATDLENAGFDVYRANDEELVYTHALKYDAYWVAVDSHEQYKIIVHDATSLYVDINAVFTDGPSHSTEIWIERIGGMNSAVYGRKQTENTNWTDREDQKIKAWPGTNGAEWPGIQDGIPFWPIGEEYMVPTTKSYAYSGLYSVLVELGVKCYNIYDNYYRNLLDGYGEVLEANGYVKYQLPDTVNPDDYNTVYEWYKDDNHKFYNCYINEEKDIAIRYSFNVSYGNLIRVFQASKIRGWDPTKDPDSTDYYDDY